MRKQSIELSTSAIGDLDYDIPGRRGLSVCSQSFPLYLTSSEYDSLDGGYYGTVSARLMRTHKGDLALICETSLQYGEEPFRGYTFDEERDEDWEDRVYNMFPELVEYIQDNLTFTTIEDFLDAYGMGSSFFSARHYDYC